MKLNQFSIIKKNSFFQNFTDPDLKKTDPGLHLRSSEEQFLLSLNFSFKRGMGTILIKFYFSFLQCLKYFSNALLIMINQNFSVSRRVIIKIQSLQLL